MLISSLIRRLEAPVFHDQTLGEALAWSQKHAIRIIPVVDRFSGYFLGSISLAALRKAEPGASMSSVVLTTTSTLVATQVILDSWSILRGNEQAHFPVVDAHRHFLGVVRREDLLHGFEHAMGLDTYGISLVVACPGKEPDLRAIIHIIEMEGVRVLSMGVPIPEGEEEQASVHLRLLSTHVDAGIASLRRHGYQVYSHYTPESDMELNDRVDELMRYLEL